MSSIVGQRNSLMFRPRTYVAFAVTPQPPIVDWLSAIDASLQRSERFFADQHVALDLSAVNLSSNAIGQLVADLEGRNIRVLGLEGIDPAKWRTGLPPILRSGKGVRTSEPATVTPSAVTPAAVTPAAVAEAPPADPTINKVPAVAAVAALPVPHKQQPASLMIEDPVRSGQSVVFVEGDITILGSVGSGAEIIAGGSIHVYGTLRGRAMAGVTGNARARIFCHRVEAELLAIDSHYRTADDIEDALRSRPAQAWLEGGTLQISAMN